ncbi:hypothetical protein UA08_06552 [Talaromyces atroroseus]|uniref:AAA+ ATPase domain-containing protein n=1 Tax=Talaromyces atroroseus TaxID=1441469 RepID=A0A225AXK0_TALAT|nr:hypothetical protein UA08_06552 [Talaromyces atroroseus]OKL58227.1 hypothetical protein UA08_06552 [Talaromyces atroroseus]
MSGNKGRSDRLAKFLTGVISGKDKVENSTDFKRFLEAILDQGDPARLVERLIASQSALSSIRQGLRSNIAAEFINKYTAKFVQFLSNPGIKQLCNGQFLEQLLAIILEPRTLWNAFIEALRARKLDEEAVYWFYWMMVEMLSLPYSSGLDVTADAQALMDEGSIFLSTNIDLRNLGNKIKYLLQMKSSGAVNTLTYTAGGRHDNDFQDFRRIAILPTPDEFGCAEKPFYRRAEDILELDGDQRVAAHIDNQFRLLREDMLSELREDVQAARGKNKTRRPASRLGGLSVASLSGGDDSKRRLQPSTLGVHCRSGLNNFQRISKEDRKDFLNNNRNFLKHQAFGCLVRGADIVAFATIERDIDKLILDSPVIMLHVAGDEPLHKTLLYLKLYDDVDFLLVDAPIFAYHPILKCLQDKLDFPLIDELFLYKSDQSPRESDLIPVDLIHKLRAKGDGDIQSILKTAKGAKLDPSQLESLLAGLTQRVSLIQGPPGTGKSFIGALLAKVLHDNTKEKILVMCYTNHALDQFLEDFQDIGINSSAIVRLGSKSTTRTQSLKLSEQRLAYKRSQESWRIINSLETEASELKSDLDEKFKAYQSRKNDYDMIIEYLEFEEPEFFEALTVPENEDGMTTVGRGGSDIQKDYLYKRWIHGDTAGVFEKSLPKTCHAVWKLNRDLRQEKHRSWKRTLLDEQCEALKTQASQINKCYAKWNSVWNERDGKILASKRIIGCTTTAAAMYSELLRNVAPGIILLEEAGEILESHVLTSLVPETKQMVLIGDHLQLRPKINNFSLTIEKGDGYDLNVSLFERLIGAGYPHTTLLKQHRMSPEISTLVRHLTYPALEDAPKTKNRPQPLGLRDRVIFFQHENPETSFAQITDRRDENSTRSKQNMFEAEIVLQIVKYLGQQGYGTDKLVVLTPYLGQLCLLQTMLSKHNDPVLNDLDSYDLVKAGLLSQASANHSKRKIKLSTIDNYQGEESDIVIASLTRSNGNGDIGFMSAPQRLNVLLSRARNALIMVGNSKTFISSRKGEKCWRPFVDQLKSKGHLYDGLPVYCQRHPDRTAILKTKDDFETECPDGGCPAPCGVKLNCGLHECPSKCHQIADHSKMTCTKIIEWSCSRGHHISQPCAKAKGSCRYCNQEDIAKERKRQRDLILDAERDRKQKQYTQALIDAQEEIAHLKRFQRDKFEDEERSRTLKQHWDEIERIKNPLRLPDPVAQGMPDVRPNQATKTVDRNPASDRESPLNYKQNPSVQQEETTPKPSETKDEWEYQKTFLNAQSSEIDSMMEMIGLETVKEKFISIKDKVDTALRQNIDLKGERFGSVLLGNPGTGKTTVARLYANFLASMGITPGNAFVETTGSRLANDGVSGCQKIIDNILNNGGGALFIDEAYQLVQGNTLGGTQVLDFLLAEVENRTGKIVFILAGYQRPMEKFFSHNPGLPSRFPHELKFDDYDDNELMQILEYRIKKKYQNPPMKVEAGFGGLYCRIVARRVGQGRGREGFANARAVENAMARISDRQSRRLKRERRSRGSKVDDFLLTKEDLIGPEPSQALENSSAWQKLKQMIGLESVKNTVKALLDSVQYNYQRELQEQSLVEFSLNRVFLGSPGTGKTTVAKLYGQILVDIGLLSNGEVVVKNPSDFVGSVVGESEKNTKGILASTMGKVLVIDEAYGLFAGGTSDGTSAKSDPYRSAVVDTIVAEVQSTPGEDRCVLLLGYKDQMQKMFQNVNPGLSRRFPIDHAFQFEDFTEDELDKILTLKLKQQGFGITEQGRRVVLEMLERARNRPHFGNAGEVDILLNSAKMRYQKRLSSSGNPIDASNSVLDAEDFDEDHDRAERADTNIAMLFEGVVGCEEIIAKLEGNIQMVKKLKQVKMNPREQVPFNFLFRGPPGTGKTSTARKMGKVYYDMGLLASAEVIEASATDLVGQYVGQTGPKTQSLLETALGKVLFIDEAYRLADGVFAKEAMDELVDCITKPQFAQRLIIILAGYDSEINQLMSTNPGLTSRFPESIQFKPFCPTDCFELLHNLLLKRKKDLKNKGQADLDLAVFECPSHDFKESLSSSFDRLSKVEGWANARDVGSLAKGIFKRVISAYNGRALALTEEMVLGELDSMIKERSKREQGPVRQQLQNMENLVQQQLSAPTHLASNSSNSSSMQSENETKNEETCSVQQPTDMDSRDTGVTDEVWSQLQRDKLAAEDREKEWLKLKEQEEAQSKQLLELKQDEERAINELKEAQRKGDEEARMRHEQERLQHEMERRQQEAVLEQIRKEKEAREKARRKEQEAQAKLRKMGVCPVGYRWIKQNGGYRCSAGGHWVSDAQLE